MRIGFSKQELSSILEIDATYVDRAVSPALEKIAKLWIRDASKTIELLLSVVAKLKLQDQYQMSEREVEVRKTMLLGRHDSPMLNGRLRLAADVATGRVIHPADERI